MKLLLVTILVGSLALALAANSSSIDTLQSSSQQLEIRKVPLQGSGLSKHQKSLRVSPVDKGQVTVESLNSDPSEITEETEMLERIGFSKSNVNSNNTIAAAGTGHFGRVAETFAALPVPVLYHQQETFRKPLKPSVVHRDPHAHFDTYDIIRTQDYDRHHQLYPTSIKDGNLHDTIAVDEHGHTYGYGHHVTNYDLSKPYNYDVHVIPECAHKNRFYYNLTFCLEDSYYPTESILWAIRQAGSQAEKLLSDVTYQSADNLVDGLTRAEEEDYTYQHYFGGSHHQHLHLDKYKPPYQGYTYSTEYYKKGGYICPSDIYYARPRRAMNTYGKWKVIVNLDYVPKEFLDPIDHGYGYLKHQVYTQTLRLEQCIYSNAPCSYIDSHVQSRCLQKHNFVRLVAWTHEQGLHIDTFKMPVACSCHIKQPVHFYQSVHHYSHQNSPGYHLRK